MAKSSYVKLGALIKDKDGGYYISVDDSLETINGKPIAPSKNGKRYISVEKPDVKYDRMLEGGHIDEDTYNERVENIPEFVKFELNVKLE